MGNPMFTTYFGMANDSILKHHQKAPATILVTGYVWPPNTNDSWMGYSFCVILVTLTTFASPIVVSIS